jgi:hypothetical protein
VVAERQRSLKIEVPTPQDDKLRFGRVGVIALVGFLIGVAWPRLAGVKLVPSVPTEDETPSVASSAEPAGSAPPAAAMKPAEAPEPEVATPPPATEPGDRLKLSEAQIVSCRDAKGNKRDNCGTLEFDRVARARLQALAACPGAPSGAGTLSLGFELDFRANKIGKVESGKSTTLDEAAVKAMLECTEREFANASLSDLKHDHERYTVFYRVEFLSQAVLAQAALARAAEGGDGGAEATSASGRATVTWEVAILRSEPKEGDIVARILRGTRVVVTGRQGDWYKVRYDAKGNEAWVFKSAIGL